MAIEIGSTVEGTVVKLAEYGVIVRLDGGKVGLVHISEVADTFVRDVRDYFKENDRIAVKVLKVNEKGRYELSAKQADLSTVERPTRSKRERSQTQPDDDFRQHQKPAASFEERLSRFLKESEERLLDLKRNIDSKRGGGRR